MAKYHITKRGEAARCRALLHCPLSGSAEHWETLDEARSAFEKQNNFFVSPSHSKTAQRASSRKSYPRPYPGGPQKRLVELFRPMCFVRSSQLSPQYKKLLETPGDQRSTLFSYLPDRASQEKRDRLNAAYMYEEATSWDFEGGASERRAEMLGPKPNPLEGESSLSMELVLDHQSNEIYGRRGTQLERREENSAQSYQLRSMGTIYLVLC
jgi:hypothetical protein